MPILTIFENELNKEPQKQFEQINLALQNISEWGKRIRNATLKALAVDTADSTASTSYTVIAGLSSNFRNNNPLVRVEINLCINTNGNTAKIALFIDGVESQKSLSTVNANHMHYFFHQKEINTGNHTIEIKWKTNTGTINKIADGGSSVIVTNLI